MSWMWHMLFWVALPLSLYATLWAYADMRSR